MGEAMVMLKSGQGVVLKILHFVQDDKEMGEARVMLKSGPGVVLKILHSVQDDNEGV